MLKKKLTIIWDVDDVLNNLMSSWFEGYWLKLHPECLLSYKGITQNPPHRLLGVSLGDYLASLDQFRMSDAFKQLTPVKEVFDWFKLYGENFRHIALTAAPLCSASVSAEWVFRYFSQWIRCFSFVPSKRDGEQIPLYDQTKKELLSWLGEGDILVDDCMENIESVKSLRMHTVLIPQPWNNSRRLLTENLELLTKLI